MPQYSKQLLAIRGMLDDPAGDSMQRGYDLLFRLWLSNNSHPEFIQELIQDAIRRPSLIGELRKRLGELRTKNTITDTYLQEKFEAFVLEVSKHKPQESQDGQQGREFVQVSITTVERQKTKFTWWQLVLAATLLIFLWFIIVAKFIFQMIIVLVVALCGLITMLYLLPKKNQRISVDLARIKLNYTFPTYLSVGDANTVHVSVENLGESEFTGKITLVFKDEAALVSPAVNESLSTKVEIPPLGREGKQFKFLLLKKPFDGKLNYYFQISSGDSQYRSDEEDFLIAPIPYLRSTWTWLFSSAGLGALIIALLWEQLEKLLGLH